ncbi:hypothetical protein ACP70R_006340 [Stipagrostis hirtigluma subsp. patula]
MDKKQFVELHEKVRKSVVIIRAVRLDQTFVVTPGTILVTGKNFCYIIAHELTFSQQAETKYQVIFPDTSRTTLELNRDDVKVCNGIAVFCIFNTSFDIMVQQVQLKDYGPVEKEEVFTLSFHQDATYACPSFLGEGIVNFAGTKHFIHDCAGYSYTTYGSPVFSRDGCFVGMCYRELGVYLTLNVKAITLKLSTVYPEMKNKEITDILLYLKDQGERQALQCTS